MLPTVEFGIGVDPIPARDGLYDHFWFTREELNGGDTKTEDMIIPESVNRGVRKNIFHHNTLDVPIMRYLVCGYHDIEGDYMERYFSFRDFPNVESVIFQTNDLIDCFKIHLFYWYHSFVGIYDTQTCKYMYILQNKWSDNDNGDYIYKYRLPSSSKRKITEMQSTYNDISQTIIEEQRKIQASLNHLQTLFQKTIALGDQLKVLVEHIKDDAS